MYSNSAIADGFIDPLLLNKQESWGATQQQTNINSDCSTARSPADETITGRILGDFAALPAPRLPNPNISTELTAGNAGALDGAIDGVPITRTAETNPATVEMGSVCDKALHSPSTHHPKVTAAHLASSSLGLGLKTTESHAAVRKRVVEKRGRPRKIPTNPASSTGKLAVLADVRAQRIRDKNRAAADKCRSRRRLEENQLKAKHECIQNLHRNLSASLSDISEEVHVLRNMLLAHDTCDCSLIQDYLKQAASKWVQVKRSTALRVAG